MFYLKIYTSIRQACHGFSYHPYGALTLISLPLLVSMPTAYGATLTSDLKTPLDTAPLEDAQYKKNNNTNNNSKIAHPNKDEDVENKAQQSLNRLAEFYQLSDNDDINTSTLEPVLENENLFQQDVGMNGLSINNPPINKSPINHSPISAPPIDDALSDSEFIDSNANNNVNATLATTAPQSTHTPNTYSATSPALQRCEGVWVTPKTTAENSDYSQAIKKAQQKDNLDITHGLPLYTQSDYAYYDSISYLELAGNVSLIQAEQSVNAENIILDLNTGIASVQGDVLLSSAMTQTDSDKLDKAAQGTTISDVPNTGLIVVADNLAYDTNTAATTAHDVAFASVPMQAHGYAQRLNRPDATHLELDKVMFTTCPPTDRKWQLEAQSIDINSETGRGQSYDTIFRLGGVPVFYLPYFEFPIDDRRSSGLLTPSARLDSENGLQISVPYYLNLAPNYDATLTTDIYTNRNPMLIADVRYLTDQFGAGSAKATFLPSDKEYDNNHRRALFYQHAWTSEQLPRLSAEAVYNYVSDSKYLHDFESFGRTDRHLNLPRRAQVNYYNDYLNSQFKIETFQSLDATDAQGNVIQDKDKPYSRLPQLSVDYRLPRFDNFLITGVHDSAYFKKSINDGSENEKSGVRIYNKVGASYPIQRSWGHLTPTVNFHHLFTAYDEQSRLVNNISKKDKNKSVFVPEFSVDSALNFYQAGSPFGVFDYSLGGYQLLTPRLKYTYTAYKDQRDIPNFNTRAASFDYEQLFADNRFLGYDRIADNNHVTLGVDYRYIDAMGVTRFDGSIGDQFYLDDIEVTLDSNTNSQNTNNQNINSHNPSSSGPAWRSSLQPYRNLWLDFSGALDSDYALNYVSSQLRYHPTPLSLINIGIVERKEDALTNQSALSAFTASTVIPFDNHWRLMAQSQFDNDNNKFIDSTVGIGYEDCCYGLSIYGRSYYDNLNFDDSPTQAIMLEFRVNGLGDRTSRLSQLLSDKVIGFEPVDMRWHK